MTVKKDPAYFMYFPGNYRWSSAFINILSAAPYGGSEISELYKIGAQLKDKAPDDDEAWFHACVNVADKVRAHAERFETSKHVSAHRKTTSRSPPTKRASTASIAMSR